MTSKTKIIAMYFTQLHAIAENDAWWGKGFTDWCNVKKAKPLFDGHRQPRVPLNSNYYDQSNIETLANQVQLARRYGIYGFCHYHYWFDGRQLLETPTNLWLDNPQIDFPFCLSWANETWSRRWDGKDHDILIQQRHPPEPESWARHFDYLIRAWTDPRAIRIDNKPVFVIYRPQKIDQIDQMLDFWNQRAIERGLEGLFYIFQEQFSLSDRQCLDSFDASFQFQPFNALMSNEYSIGSRVRQQLRQLMNRLPDRVENFLWSQWATKRDTCVLHDYEQVWRLIIENTRQIADDEFPGAFADWDNTARYGKRATIIKGASPERFGYWFNELITCLSERPESRNFLFFNAWNEWAESAYLEPDEHYRHQYLEAIDLALSENQGDSVARDSS